jgi:hypothetical protein
MLSDRIRVGLVQQTAEGETECIQQYCGSEILSKCTRSIDMLLAYLFYT